MRLWIAAPLLLALGACGNAGGGAFASLAAPLRLAEGQPDPLAVAQRESRELAEEEEDAAPRIRLALGRREAVAQLIQRQGEHRLWRAPGGVVVATEGARVVATAGLAQMVTGTRFDGPDPLEDPLPLLRRSAEARRLVDVAPRSRDPAGMRFGLAFDCRLRAFETEEEQTLLVEERCRTTGGLGAVTNRFWVDERSGRVTHAEQWVGPGLPPLTLEFPE